MLNRIVYIFFLCNFICSAQEHTIFHSSQFEKIKINQNAKSDHVISLKKDAFGFLWIGESSGLYRFDGDKPTNITLPKGLGGRMRMLHFINRDTLLIATNKGIGIVNIKTFKVKTKFFYSQNANYFLEDNFIRWIVAGKNNTTWVYTKTAIHLLNKNLDIIGTSYFKKHPEIIDANPTKPICFIISKNKLITKAVINNDNTKKNTWDLIDFENNSKTRVEIPILEAFNIRACQQIDTNQFLLTSDQTPKRKQAFYLFDYKANTLKKILDYNKSDEVLNRNSLDLSSHSEGITFFRFKTGYFYDIKQQKITEEYRNFKPYSVYLKMDNGVVYNGSSEGFFRLTPTQLKIEKLKAFNDFFKKTQFNDYVMDFLKDGKKLYIATHNQHVLMYDSIQNKIVTIKLKDKQDSGLVWNIRKHGKDSIWIGTQGGLFIFNTANKQITRWKHSETPQSINHVPITTQFTDSHNQLWMGLGYGNGLLQINQNNNQITHHLYDKDKFPLRSIRGITEDLDGNLWMGYSTGGGLIKWDRKKNTFKKIKVSEESKFTTDRIHSLLIDHNNKLWIGTRYGLFLYDISIQKFKKYTVEEGLPDNYINSLHQDNQGKIWIGTVNGLCIFNPENKNFRTFDKTQGIPGSSIQCIKPWNNDGSKLFVGAENGFCIIDTDNRIIQNNKPLFYIQPIKINEVIVNKNKEKPIRLSNKENNVSINFGVINHYDGRRNKYYYKIKEKDTSWTELKTRGELQLLGLGSGTHTIQLKTCIYGSNCYQSKNLIFEVLPPFYKSWWFISLLVLIAIALTMLFYKSKIAYIKRMETMRTQISSDLHDDVGASISSVRILSELLEDEKASTETKKSIISSIKEQSTHISNILEEIVWNVNPLNDSLENIVYRIQQYANETLEQADINVHSFIELNQINHLVKATQRKELYLLFKEAINNVLKHSNCKNAWITIKEDNLNFSFMVKDDGIGFNTEKVYKSNGLINMKKRAENLKGELMIKSSPKKGSTISFKGQL